MFALVVQASYSGSFLETSATALRGTTCILWMLGYSQEKGEDVKENIKLFIESKKFNVQNTLRDIYIIFKMMYERTKTNQLNYYPVLRL